MTLNNYIDDGYLIGKGKRDLDKIYSSYSIKNLDDDKIIYKNNYTSNKYSLIDYIDKPTPQPQRPSIPTYNTGINWGSLYGRLDDTRQTGETAQNAYVEPSTEDVKIVIEAMHMIQRLPEDIQRQLIQATKEIRFFFDGQVRAKFGGTRHFNAIRCLNNPQITQIGQLVRTPRTQLAGEEFFALNRFMQNFPDVADIQWWSLYKDGSWQLDTWNPEGEHLDTGINGWGELIGSVIKLNGQVLSPQQMIGFYRTMKLRNEREFMGARSFRNLQLFLTAVESEIKLPARHDEQVETAQDLGLIDSNGNSLTYVGRAMISQVTARQRKQRQIEETNPEIRRIIVPTIFN